MAKVLVLDVENGETRIVECEKLNDYYKELKCEIFDIATRRIGGKYFDIFCDDEGTFRENPIVSAVYPDHSPALVGNLIFANHNSKGETTSLTSKDIGMIRNSMRFAVGKDRVWEVVELDEIV